jgi:hypothetical protein
MNSEQLDAILKTAHAKEDKEGWRVLPESGTLTLYLAHDGASLTLPRIEALRTEGDILYARTPKRELYAVVRVDVYAIALDATAAAGQAVRRAGFG